MHHLGLKIYTITFITLRYIPARHTKNFVIINPTVAKYLTCVVLGFVKQVESEIISKLDVLVEGGKGDTQYKELFYKM